MILVVKTTGVALLVFAIILVQSNVTFGFSVSTAKKANLNFRTSANRLIVKQGNLASPVLYVSKDSYSEQISDLGTIPKANIINPTTYLTVFGILPLFSFFTFDWLLSQITDFNLAPADRQLWIIALLLSKRLYLYAVALTTVDLSAKRSVDLPGSLGQRLFQINGEIFNGLPLLDMKTKESIEENKEIYAALDTIDDSTQAKLIPILVAGSLLISFLLLGVTSSLTETMNITKNIADIGIFQQIQKDLGPYFLQFISSLTLFWNAAVCSLFSKSEIQGAFSNIFSALDGRNKNEKNILDKSVDKNENVNQIKNEKNQFLEILGENKIAFPFIISLLISLVAFVCPPGGLAWPVQNVLNICIAVTVARAAQLPRLPYILLALVGLVFYDVVSVVGTQQFTDNGASIMEAVARAKAGMDSLPISSSAPVPAVQIAADSAKLVLDSADAISSTLSSSSVPFSSVSQVRTPPSSVLVPSLSSWRPGLFQVVVGGKVSDVLGLADVVFPSMLAGWALRYDIAKKSFYEEEKKSSKLVVLENALEEVEEKVIMKKPFFDRIRSIFQNDNVDESNEISEISKENERENNIRAILDEEKIELLNKKMEKDLRNSVFSSSLIGYALGCFLCEIFQTGEGQPALLYIVPSMLLTVFLTGLARGDVLEFWSYDPFPGMKKENENDSGI